MSVSGSAVRYRRPDPVETLREVPLVLWAWTVGRLGLIPIVIAAFIVSPLLCAGALAAFIAADIYDGVVARDTDADGPARRALDSIVDRVSIWSVYVAVCVAGYLPLPLLSLLLVRDFYCAFWCYRMVAHRGVAIKADALHRSLNLLLAGWVVVAPLLTESLRLTTFIGILGFATYVALDLRRCVDRVLRSPASLRNVVVSAQSLRAE